MSVGILGLATRLPETIRSNAEVAAASGVTEDWIMDRTGVKRRFIAEEGVAASDLGSDALNAALEAAGLRADQLSLVIAATATPDEAGPSTACRIQHRVGAVNAAAFDIGSACAGWLFALRVARDWISASGGYVAVVTADLYNKYIDVAEPKTAVLFSDGAAATIVGEADHGIRDMVLKSDGSHAEHIIVPAGGSRITTSHQSLDEGLHTLRMDGLGLIRFTRTVFPETVKMMLERNEMTWDDVAAVVSHQPNPKLLLDLGERAGVPKGKLIMVGDEIGNVGASAAPFALAKAVTSGQVTAGSNVLGLVFGAGASWASAMFTWGGANVIQIG